MKFAFGDPSDDRVEFDKKGYTSRTAYIKIDGTEYMIATDEGADAYARGYIEETLWSFNADFIIEHSEVLDYDEGSIEILKAIQSRGEGGNAAVVRLISDMNEFVGDAIGADGRGHYMSSYDGDEHTLDEFDLINENLPEEVFEELDIDPSSTETLYLYRV